MSMSSMNWTDYIKQYYGEDRFTLDLKEFEKLNNMNKPYKETDFYKESKCRECKHDSCCFVAMICIPSNYKHFE